MTGCTAPFSETEEDINRGLEWIRFKVDRVGGWSHRPGRPREINFMSRYICFSQNGPFDVSFEELFSKVQNPGGFFRKIVF